MRKTKTKKQSRRQSTRILVGVFVSFVFLFFVGAVAYAQSVRGRILPGVTVANVAVGGLPRAHARQRLQVAVERFLQSSPAITVGSGVLRPSYRDLGVSVDIERTLTAAYAAGRPTRLADLFVIPALAREDHLPLSVSIDTMQLKSYLEKASRRLSVDAIEPFLAIKNGRATVLDGRPGRMVQFGDFSSDLERAVSALSTFSADGSVKTVQPAFSSEALQAQLPVIEGMAAAPVTLTFKQKRYVITREQIGAWLIVQPGGVNTESDQPFSFRLDQAALKDFSAAVADAVAIQPKETFGYESPEHGEYAYKNSEGRSLDVQTTSERILDVLTHPSPRTVEVATRVVPAIITYKTVQAPKREGKAIAVDLAKQTAYAFENGTLVFWTRVSTGKGAFKTPTGEWKVYTKSARQVMSGPGYYLPNVKWVLPYNGDYTLHGTYWHTNFGNPMSHGCTNLSENDAKWFYDWADIGTPVVVY